MGIQGQYALEIVAAMCRLALDVALLFWVWTCAGCAYRAGQFQDFPRAHIHSGSDCALALEKDRRSKCSALALVSLGSFAAPPRLRNGGPRLRKGYMTTPRTKHANKITKPKIVSRRICITELELPAVQLMKVIIIFLVRPPTFRDRRPERAKIRRATRRR